MKSLLLRLEGPLQSWGTQGRFSERDTDAEPSKSGVLGLVGAALGMDREDDVLLARLNTLGMAVRADREGQILRDYHTAGAGAFEGRDRYTVWGTSDPVVTQRYYLADAAFTVALGGEDEVWLEQLAAALRAPVYPLYLGRRACPPSSPVLMAPRPVDGSPEAAVRAAPFARTAAERVRLILETVAGEDAMARPDVALSFRMGARRFARRYVRTAWMDVPRAAPAALEVSP